MSKHLLDELADLVAERLEQRHSTAVAHSNPATTPLKWTDRLAATLHQIRLEQLASQGGDVVGDQPEPGVPGMGTRKSERTRRSPA